MDYVEELKKDFRYIEGLNACINCGVCTAICPAAEVSEYDPRQIVDTVQHADNDEIEMLLKGDTIWYCGECLSCKTRCPRGNTPCYIIQSLRSLSIETGLFIESIQGRKQLALKRTIGEHMLKYGYCVYIDEIDTEMFPEQGPVWEWLRDNREQILTRLGASYRQEKSGALRKIPEESMKALQSIFDVTGATERFKKIEELSEKKAREMKISFNSGKDDYFRHLYEGHND